MYIIYPFVDFTKILHRPKVRSPWHFLQVTKEYCHGDRHRLRIFASRSHCICGAILRRASRLKGYCFTRIGVTSDLSLTLMGHLASLTPAVFAQARGSFWTQGCTLGVNGHEQLWLIQSVFILQCQRQNLYGMSGPI